MKGAGEGAAAPGKLPPLMPPQHAQTHRRPRLPQTAAAVASIAFGDAAAAVDGNVIRVISRLRALRGEPAKNGKAIDALARQLLHPERPGCHNQVWARVVRRWGGRPSPGCAAYGGARTRPGLAWWSEVRLLSRPEARRRLEACRAHLRRRTALPSHPKPNAPGHDGAGRDGVQADQPLLRRLPRGGGVRGGAARAGVG